MITYYFDIVTSFLHIHYYIFLRHYYVIITSSLLQKIDLYLFLRHYYVIITSLLRHYYFIITNGEIV